jgi:hypothetical protein
LRPFSYQKYLPKSSFFLAISSSGVKSDWYGRVIISPDQESIAMGFFWIPALPSSHPFFISHGEVAMSTPSKKIELDRIQEEREDIFHLMPSADLEISAYQRKSRPATQRMIDSEVMSSGLSLGIGTFIIAQKSSLVNTAINSKKKPIYPENESNR